MSCTQTQDFVERAVDALLEEGHYKEEDLARKDVFEIVELAESELGWRTEPTETYE